MAHVDRLHLGMLCKEGRELTDVSQHPLGESSTFCMKCGLVSTVVVGETGVGWGGGDVKEEPWGRAGAWACKSPWESVGLGWVGLGKEAAALAAVAGASWGWHCLGRWS